MKRTIWWKTVAENIAFGLQIKGLAKPEINVLKREQGRLMMEEQQRHHNDELRMAAVN